MKATVAIVLGAALVGAPSAAHAQNRLDLELSPFGGGTFFFQDGPSSVVLEHGGPAPQVVNGARFEDTWSAGATAGLRLNEYFAVEALLSWTPTWLIGTNFGDGTDVYAYMYALNGVVHLPVPGPVRPFAGVGFGAETYDFSGAIRSHTHWTATFVGGLSLDVGEGRALRIQARDFLSPFDSSLPGGRSGWENDLMITAGMTWRIPLGRARVPRSASWRDFEPRVSRPK